MSESWPRKKSRLSKANLQAAGATPGFMTTRYSPEGRAEIRQLAPEGFDRKRDFIRRLTRSDEDTPASEEV